MWDILHDRFETMLSKHGPTQILCKVHPQHQVKNKMTSHFTHLINYRDQLSCLAEEISEDNFIPDHFTHIPKEFGKTINIFESQAPPAT
jgi:hypothetical protein